MTGEWCSSVILLSWEGMLADRVHRISFGDAAVRYPRKRFQPNVESTPYPQVSSLAYHETSNQIFVTSRRPTRHLGISYTRPRILAENEAPGWMLGSCMLTSFGGHGDLGLTIDVASFTISRINTRLYRDGWLNTCTAAPALSSSDLACVAGSSDGILQVRGEGGISWLTPEPTGFLNKGPLRPASISARGEIFSLDFLPSNPANIILVGGRFRHICVLDTRVSESEWVSIKHISSVAHVKAVGSHQILAAGPKSAMAVYDARYISGAKGKSWRVNGPKPVVEFPGYKNEAHIDIGLDVLLEPGYGAGVVAAAHDDGRVALYSLGDGTRLKSPAVDAINYGAGTRVVGALKFSALPGDRHASLFVGEAGQIKKYSFGRGRKDDVEW